VRVQKGFGSKAIVGIMAGLEFERALIAERGKPGTPRAKAQGKHVVRPRIPLKKETAIRRDLRPSWPIKPGFVNGAAGADVRLPCISDLVMQRQHSRC
jgi:hypothetical protein